LARSNPSTDDIKQVPEDAAVRQAIRAGADRAVDSDRLDRSRPPSHEELQRLGQGVLSELRLPGRFLGFAMVAVSNAYWRPLAEAVPFDRRLLLLPHCLRNRDVCRGTYDSVGLHCAACGSCELHGLKTEAERLGYSVIVAEGTSSVLMEVLDGRADAIVGVACLDSLEKSFERVVALGVPHVAVPLLKAGCLDTVVEIDQVRRWLAASAAPSATAPRSYLPLLRATTGLFRSPQFEELLAPCVAASDRSDDSVEAIALNWLRNGGKRLRPFVTLAAYAVARHGAAALDPSGALGEKIPTSVLRLALAIEAMHKASMVHDDVEDDDEFRYGRPTLHKTHGTARAVNVGDYLIGLGYRLIAGEAAALGAACVGDILDRLAAAHLDLCRGQDAELRLCAALPPPKPLHPAEVMQIYALKTAPAFEAALLAGLRAADCRVHPDALRRFSTYLGEAFQIRNDLDDWRKDDGNKRNIGRDVLAGRPTLLHAFALENSGTAEEADSPISVDANRGTVPGGPVSPACRVEWFFELYRRRGAFAKAERLYAKLRGRAIEATAEFPAGELREFARFLARMVLPELTESLATGP
jgi:geranylgeranyl diphosphate synthase, type II